MTDANGKGLGFILQQRNGNHWSVIQAGSRFLTSLETRYATIEKEMLGIAWAIQKCHKLLAGLPHFEILTVENARLQRLRMKIVSYNFTARGVKGSLNAGPDALSRYPTLERDTADQLAEEDTPFIFALTAQEQQIELNLRLTEVLEAAKNNASYQKLKTVIFNGFPDSKKSASSVFIKILACQR